MVSVDAGALSMPRIYATFGLADVKKGFEVSKTGKTVGKILISVSNSTGFE